MTKSASSPTEGSSPAAWPRLPALLVVGFAIYMVVDLVAYGVRQGGASGPMFGDFFALWSFGRFLHVFPASQIYDTQTLQAFQLALPGGFREFYPCPYPPVAFLLLWPLGALGYLTAYALWLAGGLTAYVAAIARRDWRSPYLWLAILAPTTLLSIIAGQSGLLTAALLIGGFRLLARRPVLGGAILGLLVFKPQFLVLAPVALLAMRQWRGLAGLALSALSLTILSVLVFGVDAWLRWPQALPNFSQMAGGDRLRLAYLMPTLTAGLLASGVGPTLSRALQVIAAIGVVASLWVVFSRRRTPDAMSVAALLVGVFLVTPYAFIYDMPMVSCAVAMVMGARSQSGRPWRTGETSLLVATLVLPLVLFSGLFKGWLLAPVVLTLLFAMIIRECLKAPDASPDRPAT